MRYLLIGLLLACTPTQRRAALAVTSTTFLAADWAQTANITRDCSELNPVLGRCGERVPVHLYFPTIIVGHLALAVLLPEWSETILGGMAGAEAATVWSNWASGASLWGAR
jgi:hypothetical protein